MGTENDNISLINES
ncbi:hypothetical protein ECEC4203_4968, partial [Escherichia coli EC4203]